LDGSWTWSDPDGSRRIVGMIKRVIKKAKQLYEPSHAVAAQARVA
jgi:hypothetical protein